MILAYCLDVFIASVFFLSFYSKVGHFSEFKTEIFSYRILPVYIVGLAAVLVLFLEVSIFFAFSFNFYNYLKEIVVVVLLIVFTFFLWKKKKRTGTSTCGCFGKAKTLNKHPFVRNFLLIGLTLLKCSMPFYELSLIRSLETSIGIITLVILYDISLKATKKGGIQWNSLES